MRLLTAFLKDTSGATALEYSMIGGLVSIVILAAVSAIGTTVSTMFLGPVVSALTPSP